MSTNQLRRYLDLLNEADAIPNPYANDPKQAAIYASLSPEDQEWATRGGGRPDLTDPYIANRAPNKFTPVAQAAPAATAQSNSGTFGNAGTELVPPNTDVALPSANTFSNDDAVAAALAQQNSDTRCAVCGTPQNQHQALKHKFVSGGTTPPAPVPQGGAIGGSGDIGRIKQLQKELKQAGANLGQTGAGRDGIDGDLGPLTQAAMSKYPDISAKYADLSGSAAAPVAQAATPAVDTGKLDAALTAIESIIAKYKGKSKVSESQIYEADRPLSAKEYQARINQTIPPDPVAREKPGFQQSKIKTGGYVPPGPTQSIYDRFNAPNPSPVGPAKVQPYTQAAAAEKGLLKGAGKWAGKAVPFVGAGLSLKDAFNRWQAGDKTGAVISTLAGAGWLVPGPAGWVLGGGLDAYNLYRGDQTGSQAVSSEDVATIQKNLKIINDWSQVPANITALTPELKSRIADVTAAGIAITKQAAATPAEKPAAPQQAATPATTVAPKLNVTLDQLDKLLKKNNFESKGNLLSESEQLARYRDIVNEGPVSWAAKNVIAPTAKFAWDKAIKPTATYAWGNVIKPSGNAVISGTIDNVIKPAAKLTAQVATLGVLGTGAWAGYEWWKDSKAPKTMNIADQAEFNRLLADLEKMLPDRTTADALPPDVQEKLIAISNRVQNMRQQGNK
jgi:hypothetical protein